MPPTPSCSLRVAVGAVRCGLRPRGSCALIVKSTTPQHHSRLRSRPLARATPPTNLPPPAPSSPSPSLSAYSSSSAAAAETMLRQFYGAYNAGDAAGATACMAEACAYHDTVFPEPFFGRLAVRGHFERTFAALGPAVKFCVDAVAASPDGLSAGVKWHCELDDGTPLPNSRGVSFYEFERGTGLVLGARDCVEPAIKPGGAALVLLRAVLPAVRAAGRAEKAKAEGGTASSSSSSSSLSFLATQTPASAVAWAGFGLYFASIFFSSSLPGVPVWATPSGVLAAVWHESLNFFYVNNGLHALGVTLIPDTPEHPASEAIFNFDAAWGLLFGPAWLADWRRREVAGVSDGDTAKWWVGTMLLTNVFAWPYMAARVGKKREQVGPAPPAPPPTALSSGLDPAALPAWAPAVGVVGALVGAVSIAWAALARPEAGDLAARAAWFADAAGHSDRAIFAFTLDACCYAVWQAVLLKGAGVGYRWVPYFGLAAWLVTKGGGEGVRRAEK